MNETDEIFPKAPIAVILAGGRSRRMGRDKALIELAGQPLARHVLTRLAGQAETILLNANAPPARFKRLDPLFRDMVVIADPLEGYRGPLAGVLAGLQWARVHRPGLTHVLTVAADTPFFPLDLSTRLQAAIANKGDEAIAVPQSLERLHPAFGLWPVTLADQLERWLEEGGRRVRGWLEIRQAIAVPFPVISRSNAEFDSFFNINTPQDLLRAEQWLSKT